MKVVHLLRKPCSEGTVAANVLRHGTGALNIDACRISATDAFGGGAKGTSGFVDGYAADGWVPGSPLGRWPANLVLQHLDGCVQDGTKKVGSGNVKVSGIRTLRENPVYGVPNTTRNAPDSYGTETVAAWVCAPGCPVAALDQQSGVSKSTGGRIGNAKGVYTNLGSTGWSGKHAAGDPGFGDTGGASRFFHQSRTLPYDYLRKLISPDHLPGVVYLHVTAPDTLAKKNDAAVHAMTVLAASTDTHWIPHALRVLKPGGHLLLAAPDAEPTNDTLICAAEGAGFEVRDCIFLADSVDDRLHYVAKAGKKEREAGLERMPAKAFAASGGAQGALADSEDEGSAEYGGDGDIGLNRITMRKNTHPTVKPIAVMRRLLAGVGRDLPVLDPFVGSGTTLLACVAEGCDGIGVEREGEYFAIATARVDARVSGMLATRTDGEARVEWVEEG